MNQTQTYNFALVGSGVMGSKLALNIESRGYSVLVFDIDPLRIAALLEQNKGRRLGGTSSAAELAGKLERPRKILLMVPAGPPVDSVITSLLPHLEPGDILIDGGNSWFKDSEARARRVEAEGKSFIGMGVSGGEEGALHGPSLMPGGSRPAWEFVQPILEKIAARAPDGTPCCRWIGPGGAGHYVKMVHNGIEYADMSVICSAYAIMRDLLRLSPPEMKHIFEEWNQGELQSYLIEITARVLGKRDAETSQPMVDVILDCAGQKGTGAWTAQNALELGIPVPTIAEAVFERSMAAMKEERIKAAAILGPTARAAKIGNRDQLLEQIRQALYVTKICAYAQGFALLRGASEAYQWNLNFSDIAAIWRAGCIIRASLLERIMDAYSSANPPPNLLLHDYFKDVIRKYERALREVVCLAASQGIPVPAFSSALFYLDSYRSERLPANLLQAQRDYFGAHTFERIDKPGHFHADWDSLEDLK